MDESTIILAANGDIKAFKKIFDLYLPKMRPIANRYALSNLETEDILQESFVKIYYNLKSFKFSGSFEGWIRRIVVNTSINHYKKNKNSCLSDDIYNLEIADGIEDDEEIITDGENLLNLIRELPPGYKMVLNLYVFEDYNHSEIADMLGISEGTSRSQYSKAKKMLRKLFDGQRLNTSAALSYKNRN